MSAGNENARRWLNEEGGEGVAPGYGGRVYFGLWSVCFPPALVRTARRLPVEALCESGVLVSLAGYPRGGAPGPGAVPGLPEIKEKSGIWNLVPVG